jgi:hypothetical protein
MAGIISLPAFGDALGDNYTGVAGSIKCATNDR